MRKPLPEALQVPWGMIDALLVFVMAWIGAPIAVILVAHGLAPYWSEAAQFYKGIQASNVSASFVLALIDAAAGLGIVWYYLRKYRVGWATVGWRKFNVGKALLLIVGMFLSFLAIVTAAFILVSFLIPGFNSNQAQTNDFTGSAGMAHHSLALIALVILPPIIEETIFRGFIFPAFSKRFGAIFGAIITSILFGFAHLQANISVYTFILSLLLCFMYYRLHSIFPGMALHMLNNYIAFIALSGK